MKRIDPVFQKGDREQIWQKFCGFYDLSIQEFLEIQNNLLLEEFLLISGSAVAKKIMPRKPDSIAEFRSTFPFTTYEDYAPFFEPKDDSSLPEKPIFWTRTSGRGGNPKWQPYTQKAIDIMVIVTVGMMIAACAGYKGDVRLAPGAKIMQNLPPMPYGTGILARYVSPYIGAREIPPLDEYEGKDFEVRVQAGFQMGLRTGVDLLTSLTSVLVKMGQSFAERTGKIKLNKNMLHPAILARYSKALLKSKWEKRPLLPKDLWPLYGLMCYGTDTSIYKEQLKYYWGAEPFETYGATEAALISAQSWTKKAMTFIPYNSYIEFIPQQEWIKNKEDKNYKPATVLLNEVKAGEIYEIVTTRFHGIPFLRYRLGDLIKIVALDDKQTGITTPQMEFYSRADDLIDIAGFARLDEKTIWQAIIDSGVAFEDWCVRKEFIMDKPSLHLYIEFKDETVPEDIGLIIHNKLSALNKDYGDIENLLGLKPVSVTSLKRGSFARYFQKKKSEGVDLAQLKPAHMSPPEKVIKELL
jgi:hypothetical protein